MTVRFHRSREIELILPNPGAHGRRGLFFDVVVGVEAAVDAASGMTVNLTAVDAWLDRLPREARDVYSWLEGAWASLEPLAKAEGARLHRVQAANDGLSWARLADGWEEVSSEPIFVKDGQGVERSVRRRTVRSAGPDRRAWRDVAVHEQRGLGGPVQSRFI